MTPTAEKAYRDIKERIVEGKIEPGYRVTEVELANQLAMSRTPVRDALKKLVEDRWLEYTPNVGMRVRAWSTKDILDNLHVRQLLECEAAALASQHITPDQLDTLKLINTQLRAIATLKTAEAVESMTSLNLKFHQVIWNSTTNRVLSEILLRNVNIPTIATTYQQYSWENLSASLDDHDQLIACIGQGKAEEAKRTMASHLQRATRIYKSL